MIVFQQIVLVGNAHGHIQLNPILRLVRPVAALAFRRPYLDIGHGVVTGQFTDIIRNAVPIQEFLRFKAPPFRQAEEKQQVGIDNGLAAQNIPEVICGDLDIGKHLDIRLKADDGTGILFGIRFLFQSTDVLAVFKVKGIPKPVPAHLHIHIFRGILGGAGAKPVEPQRKLVALPFIGVVFATGIQLAEDQLPIIPLFLLVVIHRHAASEILYLNGAVLKAGGNDFGAKSLPRLVNRVGQDLKHRMFTALQPIGAENNGRALANPVGSFERGDALIAIALLFRGHGSTILYFLSGSRRFVTKYGYTLLPFPGSCQVKRGKKKRLFPFLRCFPAFPIVY